MAATYDSTFITAKIYVDGALDKIGTYTTAVDARLDSAWLGGWNSSGGGVRWFDGRMDDVRIYRRLLSDTEIKAIYQATERSD